MKLRIVLWFLALAVLTAGTGQQPREAVRARAATSYVASRPLVDDSAAGARVEYLDDGVRVEANDASASYGRIAMHLARIGREGSLLPASEPEPPVRVGSRVEYRRGSNALTEWYVNGPLGLEQGFTFEARPVGVGRLVLELAVADGVEPRLASDGNVDLYRVGASEGMAVPVGRYSGLHVKDARGRALEARLEVAGGAIAIAVDDSTATYPLVVDPNLLLQQSLQAPSGGQFGYIVAIDGDTAAVAAIGVGGENGAVYIYVRGGTGWPSQPTQTINGAAGDQFGLGLGLSGNTLFVGAPNNSRTYIYTRTQSGSPFVQLPTLLIPHDVVVGDYFGSKIAVVGETVLIGASSKNNSAGSAYVFGNSSGTWQEEQELVAFDAIANAGFGWNVALSSDGSTALIGAPGFNIPQGAAYVFSRPTGQATFNVPGTKLTGGLAGNGFGDAVAMSGSTTAFVGAPTDQSTGAVYVFNFNSSSWQQIQALPGASGDQFGNSLAFSGTTLLVGAPGNQAATVVTDGMGVWSEQLRLSQGTAGFGQSVALTGTTSLSAVVGAAVDSQPSNPGAAFIFGVGTNAVPALGGKAPLLALILGLGGLGMLAHVRRRPVRH